MSEKNDGKVFEFISYEEWCNRWHLWFGTRARLFDAKGKECRDTMDMKAATYPVALCYTELD